jgi:hypothetical protein
VVTLATLRNNRVVEAESRGIVSLPDVVSDDARALTHDAPLVTSKDAAAQRDNENSGIGALHIRFCRIRHQGS